MRCVIGRMKNKSNSNYNTKYFFLIFFLLFKNNIKMAKLGSTHNYSEIGLSLSFLNCAVIKFSRKKVPWSITPMKKFCIIVSLSTTNIVCWWCKYIRQDLTQTTDKEIKLKCENPNLFLTYPCKPNLEISALHRLHSIKMIHRSAFFVTYRKAHRSQ